MSIFEPERMYTMFDRNRVKFTSQTDWEADLLRFNGDEYAAKYLANVYNPEHRTHVARLKDSPAPSMTGICFAWGKREFHSAEEVF
jgi:hypothetical protein